MATLISGGTVVNADGVRTADVVIEGERIAAVVDPSSEVFGALRASWTGKGRHPLMLTGLNLGISFVAYSMTSVTSRSEGRTGRRCVPRAMNSLNRSFWTVPRSFEGSTPCFFATAISSDSSTMAVELIVIEMLILSRGMPSSSVSMSARLAIDTPTRPTSPAAITSSGS